MRKPIFVIFMTFASGAIAADERVNTVGTLEGCRAVAAARYAETELDGVKWGTCVGIIQTMKAVGGHLQPNMRNCIPPAASAPEMAKALFAFADKNAVLKNEPIEVLVLEAMRTNWPCRKN